jgi:primosomal protein N' (replication factor Y)
MPKVYPVDMRMELKRGNRKILSNDMMRLIRETIQQGQQMILMLNRRGFSTFIMCRECGHVIKCPDCGLPMVYHKANTLMCHHCDTHLHPPSICPQCGSTYIRYFGSGTEKLEAELKELVQEARVVRLDRDTTQRKFSQTEILSAFSEGKYDILLGTQMVAKGHDVPNVTASGILSADAALNLPDFRAAERCFMLIAQTAGRSGRGEIPGKVLVQCYNPEHYAVQYACEQNYHAFFEHEIEIRKALYYPPFCRLIKLTFVGDTEDETRKRAESLKDKFVSYFSGRAEQQIIGPAPDTIPVFRGRYRYNLVIKAGKYLDTLQFMRENNLHEDTNVLIDIDPINI